MSKQFKALPSLGKKYHEQGYIFFTCRQYKSLRERERRKLDELFKRAGGEISDALKEFMTTDANSVYICQKYFISESTLMRARKRLYEKWR